MALDADLATLDAVEARVREGVARQREMTRDEQMSVLRAAVFFRDACDELTRAMIERGEESMSLGPGD